MPRSEHQIVINAPGNAVRPPTKPASAPATASRNGVALMVRSPECMMEKAPYAIRNAPRPRRYVIACTCRRNHVPHGTVSAPASSIGAMPRKRICARSCQTEYSWIAIEQSTIVCTTRTGSCATKASPIPASAANANPATLEMVAATRITAAVSTSVHAAAACVVADAAINSAWITHQPQRTVINASARKVRVFLASGARVPSVAATGGMFTGGSRVQMNRLSIAASARSAIRKCKVLDGVDRTVHFVLLRTHYPLQHLRSRYQCDDQVAVPHRNPR